MVKMEAREATGRRFRFESRFEREAIPYFKSA
jgi:hypothetical protein